VTRDAKQLAGVVGIVVIEVVLGLTLSAAFFILIAGPIVVLIQYAWQNSGWSPRRRTADPSRALVRDLLGDRRAKPPKDQRHDQG
jgi:hypothetical protein